MSDHARGNLWLLRHGDTEWAASGRHTGLTDIPLSPAGEAAARQRSQDLEGHSFALILCSPLERARRTAEFAGVTPDAIDPDLLEWDCGAWEGRTTAEIRAGRDCLLVAHGHLLRMLAATWLGLPARDGRLWALSAGGLSVLGWERAQPVISRWNV